MSILKIVDRITNKFTPLNVLVERTLETFLSTEIAQASSCPPSPNFGVCSTGTGAPCAGTEYCGPDCKIHRKHLQRIVYATTPTGCAGPTATCDKGPCIIDITTTIPCGPC